MEDNGLRDLLDRLFLQGSLSKAIISNRKRKTEESPLKVTIKPFDQKGTTRFQFERHYQKKVTHENLDPEDAIELAEQLLLNDFKQGDFKTTDGEYQVLVSKKGATRIKEVSSKKHLVDLTHDRKKNYILQDGEPVDYLVHLGVMSPEGTVYKKKYDKFRQINRFLELVEDVADTLKDNGTIKIVDFGCGKSYLTFALYHYLSVIRGLDINIIGMDLKKDVIDFCNDTAEKLGNENLKFICGDIADYVPGSDIDMVVTLHACDTATDIALVKAAQWGARVIMSVPCCQHELFSKIKNPELNGMLKHGIIKERLSSLVTDSIRGSILEILGYQVQILEFVDMEHTPKNIMIRAVRTHEAYRPETILEYKQLKSEWGLEELFIESYMGDYFKVQGEERF
ncbi:class I SAM-dependent methyltransferase [Gudongella oleilytica]|uniref:class I SAM-dependent methyltransferase n=1 Tax=Gudongella oleilytica TaxID=1582259 RepID=UPI000FF87A7B|nr:SAM-dependent methyltransferase [Gudongella oleilytica]